MIYELQHSLPVAWLVVVPPTYTCSATQLPITIMFLAATCRGCASQFVASAAASSQKQQIDLRLRTVSDV